MSILGYQIPNRGAALLTLQAEDQEELSPTQIRDHDSLILKVWATFPTTCAEEGALEFRREGAPPQSK